MESLPTVAGQCSPVSKKRSRHRRTYPLHDDTSIVSYLMHAVEINTNATSTVWKVPVQGQLVALKEVSKASLFTDVMQANATAEVAALRALRHANIVEFAGAFQTADNLYVAMRYHKQDLYDYTTSTLLVDTRDAERWVQQLASALAFMKTKGYLHRDIKLENVLLGDRKVYLADFGLSIKKNEATRDAAGTWHCIAPEMKAGLQPGYEIDAWGLGVLLFELLSGAVAPFTYEQVGGPDESGHQPFEKNVLRSSSPKCLQLMRGFLQRAPSRRLRVEDVGRSQTCVVS